MKKTGQILRENREKQQLTISEVSLATKINPRVLQAMESGNMERLPAHSFLRGFIRSYASYLKLDGDELLTIFNEELHPKKEIIIQEVHPSLKEIKKENREDKPSSSAKWSKELNLFRGTSVTSKTLATVGVVILIALIIAIKGLVEKYEKEGSVPKKSDNLAGLKHGVISPTGIENNKTDKLEKEKTDKTDKTEPSKSNNLETIKESNSHLSATTGNITVEEKKIARINSPVEEKKSSKEESISGSTSGSTKKENSPNVSNVSSLPASSPSLVAPAPMGQNLPPQKVVPSPLPPQTVPSAPSSPASQVAETSSIPQEVIIEALDKVEVSFRIDGGAVKKMVLLPEQVHTIKAKSFLTIDIADGGAINVIHNGIDKGVPGDLGKPKKIKFP